MNNQVTIIDNQNQTLNVDCICYFLNNKNNKKYIFYTKNEIVQDGLVKMYVAEENNGVVNDITLDEWSDLKLVMQDIIKGVYTNSNIGFLPVLGNIKLAGEKVIALNQTNIDVIKNSYKNDAKVMAAQNTVSNKDLLSQSFSSNNGQPIQAPVQEPQVLNPQANVVNNSSNQVPDLEASAANLNMMSTVENGVSNNNSQEIVISSSNDLSTNPLMNEINQSNEGLVNEKEKNMFSLPSEINVSEVAAPSVSEEVTVPNVPDAPAINNDFQVSSAPNIFDLPTPEVNIPSVDSKPLEQTIKNNEMSDTSEQNLSTSNLFDMPSVPNITELKDEVKIENPSEHSNSDNLDTDILEARIAIEKSNYKLFMSLAENSEKMAKLLESQMKSKSKEENLENTASDLFKSNGALDENKVLGLSA